MASLPESAASRPSESNPNERANDHEQHDSAANEAEPGHEFRASAGSSRAAKLREGALHDDPGDQDDDEADRVPDEDGAHAGRTITHKLPDARYDRDHADCQHSDRKTSPDRFAAARLRRP